MRDLDHRCTGRLFSLSVLKRSHLFCRASSQQFPPVPTASNKYITHCIGLFIPSEFWVMAIVLEYIGKNLILFDTDSRGRFLGLDLTWNKACPSDFLYYSIRRICYTYKITHSTYIVFRFGILKTEKRWLKHRLDHLIFISSVFYLGTDTERFSHIGICRCRRSVKENKILAR